MLGDFKVVIAVSGKVEIITPYLHKKTAWQSLIDKEEKEVIVAVIDTGVNIEHEALSGKIWVNEHEVLNRIDDDGNGYVDDIY